VQSANEQGIPGTILKVLDLLRNSPTGGALTQILSGVTSGLPLPEGLGDYLPAFASTVRVMAGLMVCETVLAEGERLSGIVANQFSSDRARQLADSLQASFQLGGQPLDQVLATADPGDAAGVYGNIVAVQNVVAQLASLDDYVSQGMGFGEATLVHFDINAAQTEVAVAAALLRNPDLSSLRRVMESLARVAEPVSSLIDPGTAAARGLEDLFQLVESQVTQAATAIRNLNADVLVTPLANGLSAITAPLHNFTNLVAQVVTEVRAVLQQVQAAVAALPIDDLARAIRTALQPVLQALHLIQQLVDDIRAALEAAAQTALTTLGQVEHEVDDFKQKITDLFAQARQFVDGLHLDRVVSTISGKVNDFVGLLHQAQMKPYFDTAASAISSAASVIGAVPFNLLPESMKADVDAALAPVRDVDAAQVEAEIESLLQIGPDGKFQLRGDLEQALAAIQAKFDEVLKTLDDHHPSKYLDQIDQQLSALAAKIQALSPQLTLEPVQHAIQQVKSALGSFDLERELQPVQDVFDRAMAALDQYSPAQLLQPLEQRVTDARNKLEQAIRINDWRPTIDGLATTALHSLNTLDPAAIESLLESVLGSLQREVANLPSLGFGNWLGMIVAGLMRGSNLRITASSIDSVLRWTSGSASSSTELTARAARISASLTGAKAGVEAFDPVSLSTVATQATALQSAVNGFAARLVDGSDQRLTLEAAANRLDAASILGRMSANRARYLALLTTAAPLGDVLARTGLSEADVAVRQLQDALSPLNPLFAKVRLLASYLGIVGTQQGFLPVLQSVFQVVTPHRVASLVSTLAAALRDRLQTLIDQILAPVRAAIDDLKRLIGLIDLQPVIDGVNAVFLEVKNQLLAFSPKVLLHDPLAAFASLKQDLLTFDPLAPILTTLNGLRDTSARIVQKLSARKLLESPLAIYDAILNPIHQLNIENLLSPVLDVLDSIADQVDKGLDETVAAFQRLQQSLPAPGGGSSAQASVAVG